MSGHANQITTGAVRELNGVDVTGGTDNISNVGDRGTRGGAEVENLGTGLDVDLIETTENTSSQLSSHVSKAPNWNRKDRVIENFSTFGESDQ